MADSDTALRHIQAQVIEGKIRVTQHAQQEMTEEDIILGEVCEAIANGEILESYPYHRRGACCLLNGYTANKRFLHIVCTTRQPVVIIITTYEPKPPKWVTPTQRGDKK